ncbi:MAG: pilus assembly protein N-terminal domain-containing protein [Desulfosarcinaceae bacterium]
MKLSTSLQRNQTRGWLLFTLALIIFIGAAPAAAEKIMLSLGQQKTISAPKATRVAVGDPRVADVKAIEKAGQVLVTAVAQGVTDIIIWDRKGNERTIQVQVIRRDPKVVLSEVRELLHDVEGIRSRTLGSRVIIEGQVLRKQDLTRIATVTQLYPEVTNFAKLSPAVMSTTVKAINDEFDKAGLTDVRAVRVGNQIHLEGDVPNKASKLKAETIASAFTAGAKSFVNVGVSMEKMVLVNVDFIEIDKASLTEAGIKWGESLNVTGDANASGLFGAVTEALTGGYTLAASYGVTINMLKNSSHARILSRPNLVCRSGEEAEFLAGGEVAIPIVTANTTTIQYKEFGLILKIAPVVDRYDRIATKIKVENSQISDFVEGNPNFQTSRVDTSINLNSGETLVLSGLVSSTNAKAVDKLPVLGDIPILGELFKSRRFQKDESELLIFVTPRVTSAQSEEQLRMVENMRKKADAETQNLKFSILD